MTDEARVRPLTCTGVAATWCPRCGDCTCGPGVGGELAYGGEVSLDDPGCPLHAIDSYHGAPAQEETLF